MNYQYVNKPNIPSGKVSRVIVDYRISNESEKTLQNLGIELIKTIPEDNLYEQVNGHPDMQIHHLGGNDFICTPFVYTYYKENLKGANIFTGTRLFPRYPNDISYNGVLVNDVFFHKIKYTQSEILDYYSRKDIKLVNINQGYSKCSVAVISDNAIITSDKIIFNKALENKLNALYVDPSQIILNGMSNGFIGGCCGMIDKNTLAINGSIKYLGEGIKIKNFCNEHNVKILELQNTPLTDIGSIMPITVE